MEIKRNCLWVKEKFLEKTGKQMDLQCEPIARPRLSYLTPFNFFLCGQINDHKYWEPKNSLDHLETRSKDPIEDVSAENTQNAWNNIVTQ